MGTKDILLNLRLIEIDPRAETMFVGPVGASVKYSMARSVSDAADRIERLERETLDLHEHRAKLQRALSFAASVIKSGEPWTPTCDAEIGTLLQKAPSHE